MRTGGTARPCRLTAGARRAAPRRQRPAAPRHPARARRRHRPAPAGAPIAFPDGADEVLLPMTQMRKGIAAQMTRALAGAARLRPHGGRRHAASSGPARAAKRDYQAREGISLSYVPFVIKATVEALKQ